MDSQGADHYFVDKPSSPDEQRTIHVTLAGKDMTLTTAPGIFSPDKIDPGTHVLLSHVPDPPAQGNLLDLGCGWGPMAITLALKSPEANVWAVDVNTRSLDLARLNADAAQVSITTALPDDVPPQMRFTTIWSNPPIRIGKQALHDMLLMWLPRLEQSGRAYLVIQKHLGADSLHDWLSEVGSSGEYGLWSVQRIASSKGYRLLEVTMDSPV